MELLFYHEIMKLKNNNVTFLCFMDSEYNKLHEFYKQNIHKKRIKKRLQIKSPLHSFIRFKIVHEKICEPLQDLNIKCEIKQIQRFPKNFNYRITKALMQQIGESCQEKVKYTYIPNGAVYGILPDQKKSKVFVSGYKTFDFMNIKSCYDLMNITEQEIYRNQKTLSDKKDYCEYLMNQKLHNYLGVKCINVLHSEILIVLDILNKYETVSEIYITSYKNCCHRCLKILSLVQKKYNCKIYVKGYKLCGHESDVDKILGSNNNPIYIIRSDKI